MKFKVWDTIKKRFLIAEGGDFYLIGNDDKIYFYDSDSRDLCGPIESSLAVFSTGVHDKNGVELFDGDIFHDGDLIGVINYSKDGAAYMITETDYLGDYHSTLEKIGSKLETPELLQ